MAKRLQDQEQHAVFTYCCSHSVILANDSIKKSKFMKALIETVSEITKVVILSPRPYAIFEEFKSNLDSMRGSKSPAICLLCPTRWTVRADSIHAEYPQELSCVIRYMG